MEAMIPSRHPDTLYREITGSPWTQAVAMMTKPLAALYISGTDVNKR
jgi:hypothetical protein